MLITSLCPDYLLVFLSPGTYALVGLSFNSCDFGDTAEPRPVGQLALLPLLSCIHPGWLLRFSESNSPNSMCQGSKNHSLSREIELDLSVAERCCPGQGVGAPARGQPSPALTTVSTGTALLLSLTRLGSRVIGTLLVWMPLLVISGSYSRGAENLQKQGFNAERVTTGISGDVEKMRGLA